VTFDADGLIGVRIDRETLTSELAAEVNNYGVQNSGTVIANIEY
jgi:hypothetical protein